MEDRIMEFILARVVQTGTTPSVRELAKAFDYDSENSVRHYLKKLRESASEALLGIAVPSFVDWGGSARADRLPWREAQDRLGRLAARFLRPRSGHSG